LRVISDPKDTSTAVQPGEPTLEERFAFGSNWARFLHVLDDSRIAEAEKSLREMLGVERLDGRSFIDVGCGSGLFSLVARRLGARVHSFDFDPQSVACARELKRRFFPDDADWSIERASVLDAAHLDSLGRFDVVYSWGVLHHTGQMWKALANVDRLVADGGCLFIAIYNDQAGNSRRWKAVKRLYNASPGFVRGIILVVTLVYIWALTVVVELLRGKPFHTWRHYRSARGMSPWHDHVDWIGGWPFEVAKPEELFDFYRARGYELRRMKTCGAGKGCNELVFVKSAAGSSPPSATTG
jgi:SAM-dependent methyltransferase